MKHRTWPHPSRPSHFCSLRFNRPSKTGHRHHDRLSSTPAPSSDPMARDFSHLPYDVLLKIAAPFTLPDLRAASLVCRSWRDGLRPLCEAMVFLRWGKRFKHGRGGVRPNMDKALESFLKGAARGSSLAMVDAGLVYWEAGKREEGVRLYRMAAELGDPAGQCNLGISYLQAETQNLKEAVKWLYKSSSAGYVRAQYQLALCLHQGRGVECDIKEARSRCLGCLFLSYLLHGSAARMISPTNCLVVLQAKWYLRAAEGGYVRAMYNTSLCYTAGEGLVRSHRQARKWMKRAADHGHSKAQFEHGLALFSEGEMMKAVVYLELATRGGEAGAANVKNIILQQLSAISRDRAIFLADNWKALPSPR
ncbi:hypothetical protein Syun_024187 [Stephania yunnanensis]|uniref:F-box domain-containing protein n=1 Tax=Stephania yunnanensis TaxID=152371 RepID=A0AAP0FBE7_9MAGN